MNKLIYIITFSYMIFISACNSDPENKNEEYHEEESSVKLTASQYKNASIAFGKVEMKNISSTLPVNGLLDVPPQNLVTVAAMMGGFVKSTHLLQGMRVKKGEVLVTIQNPDFIQIQQDYLNNKSKLLFAEQEYKRQEELAKDNVASQKTFQQVTSEYQSLKAMHEGLLEKLSILGINPSTVENGAIKSIVSIVSPISGYVTAVNINIGKYVNPQDLICEIVDTDHLHAELTVFEKDVFKVKEGQKIKFQLVNEEHKFRTATVYLINRKIGEDRTVRVHAHLDKEDRNLLPNTYLKAFIEITDNLTTALPDEAVVSSGGKYFIFIKDEGHGHTHEESVPHERNDKYTPDHKGDEGKHKEEVSEEFSFKSIEVKKGVSQNGFTEVILPEGFETDAEVVVKGAYALLSKMNNSEEEGHGH
ncbi:MAG: efflux RND transporter periplasmic adaptor subunit [Sporocytophaga sp.]|uniref:efflux RND transporter periplasmic adaptor subunit n=1 Tax=Sporocytophaga sp. TaxID=2231183 RepID=UPI001B146E46|nr:efflux RND transporter periplasmic adaptor subunit [Sporocytophaga sp.]MBO9702964.1 efflux RND transporter periplasmic adaptor subunit [Sporocytophaga sp.]